MDIQRLKEIFEKQSSFAVIVGQAYTIDEMASALSIYLTLKSLGKEANVVSAKQPLVEVSSLVGIDAVKPSYEANGGDLIVSFPYQQDEIGKVSYTLESGLLNIIVKPKDAPLSFGEKDVIFKRSGGLPQVLVTVGVKRISELQSFFDLQALKDTTIVNIDRAGTNEGFGDVVVIGEGASSVSEQVANLMLSLGFTIDPDMSQNLMSGIVGATANFQSPRTSSLAFEMAGILLRNGAKRENVAVRPQVQPQRTPQQQFGYPSRPTPQARVGQVNQPRIQQLRSDLQQVARNNQTQPDMQQVVRNTSSQTEFPREQKKDEAPPDWLAPKIFKGSTTVE